MRIALVLILALSTLHSFAEEEPPVTEDPKESVEAAEAVTPESEQAPEAETLRSRDLGDAFKNFQPSEAISADNAVSFPVDI